jgi:hypothetical protein
LLSVVVPAALIGHLSIRSITVKRQIWWYPESFLLQNFMLLSFASVIFMSLFVHSEESLQKTVDEACNILFRSDDPQMILLKQSVVTMVKYSVGMGTLTKMLLTLITFCLARLITEKIKKNILPGFDFCNLTMNGFMAVVPVTALTAALLFPDVSFVCSGIFMVGLFAPLMCGFAVIRRLSRGRNGLRLRIILWCLMLFLTLPTILGIILLGIADSFYPLCRDVTEV